MDLSRIAVSGYQFHNWSKTYSCQPELLFIPETIDEIREILYLANTEKKRIRVIGRGNSPSDICCSEDYMINMERFNNVLHIDRENRLVTVQAGINIKMLNLILEQNDLAMPILGSISDSALAGVISVGTHGTGFRHGIIADYVRSILLIIPSGDIIVCSKQQKSEIFYSVLCGLGALGIILEVTIECERKFYLHQLTYPSTLDSILDRLDENVESCDHFRFLYFPHTDYVNVSITNRVNGEFLNLKNLQLHDDARQKQTQQKAQLYQSQDSISLLNEYEQLELTNPYGLDTSMYRLDSEKTTWQKILDWVINYGVGYHFIQFAYWLSTYVPQLVPAINKFAFWFLYSSNQVNLDISYKIFNFECLFDQHVNEWAIPRYKTVAALTELKQAIDNSKTFYAHFPIEVRFVRPSPIYLSGSYGRDSTYINIICYQPYGKRVDCKEYWDCYEKIMKRNGGRPHWAKDHRETARDLIKMYPYFRAWSQIRKRLDPNRLFFNAYLDRIFSTFPISNTALSSGSLITSTPTILKNDNNNDGDHDDKQPGSNSSMEMLNGGPDDFDDNEIFSSTTLRSTSSDDNENGSQSTDRKRTVDTSSKGNAET